MRTCRRRQLPLFLTIRSSARLTSTEHPLWTEGWSEEEIEQGFPSGHGGFGHGGFGGGFGGGGFGGGYGGHDDMDDIYAHLFANLRRTNQYSY